MKREDFLQKNETAFVGIKDHLREALESIEQLEDALARVPRSKSSKLAAQHTRDARAKFPCADSILYRSRLDDPTLIEKNPKAAETVISRILGLM